MVIVYQNNPYKVGPNGSLDIQASGFVLSPILTPGDINVHYTYFDRMVAGGVWVKSNVIELAPSRHFGTTFFLERREIAIYCLSNTGSISIGDETHLLNKGDVLYAGLSNANPIFHPLKTGDARFYFVSTPAHRKTPTRIIKQSDVTPKTIGEIEKLSHREIYKMVIHPDVDICQLQTGMTRLKEHQLFNTIPPHTHSRRSEIYFYFDLDDDNYVQHFMGEPDSIESIKLRNNQAIVVPPGHVHYGKGTSEYSFIWAMGGENLDYDDMDPVENYPL